jgi:hypothetical protein
LSVAHLWPVRPRFRVGVVAVIGGDGASGRSVARLCYDLARSAPIPVCICVEVEQSAFVDVSVAVVVFQVAALVGPREGAVVSVVAVGVLEGAVLGEFAHTPDQVRVAKAVAILVEVRKQTHAFVNEAITVIVDTVAQLCGTGVDGGVCLITVFPTPKSVQVGVGSAGREESNSE